VSTASWQIWPLLKRDEMLKLDRTYQSLKLGASP
jgi:hypothetical protein